jgi:hypothetical protein
MEKSWRKNIKGGSFGIIFEKFCPYIKDLWVIYKNDAPIL